MRRIRWRPMAIALGLALGSAAAAAAPAHEAAAPEAEPAPALRGQVFQRSRSTFDIQGDGEGAALARRFRGGEALGGPPGSPSLRELARGALLRTQLSEDASLTLRLRGGKVGLYLAVRLTNGD